MKTRIMYLENKETGEARIGRVTFSRTFQTVYYKNRTIHRAGSEKIQTATKKNMEKFMADHIAQDAQVRTDRWTG